MKRIIKTAFILALVFQASFACASEMLPDRLSSFLTIGDHIAINYSLEDEGGDFVNSIIDALKAGKTIKVVHEIEVSTIGAWPKNLAEAEVHKYVSYNHLKNTYNYGNDEHMVQSTNNTTNLKKFLLSVDQAPIIDKSYLKRATEYNILTHAKYTEVKKDSGWIRYLPSAWFRETLSAEVQYIAR